jgi:hypothetical protein
MKWWPFRQRDPLPLVTMRYYRPDLWVPEVGRRCDLCGEWFTTIGTPAAVPEIAAHEGCSKATPSALSAARELVLLKNAGS